MVQDILLGIQASYWRILHYNLYLQSVIKHPHDCQESFFIIWELIIKDIKQVICLPIK